MTGDCKHYVSAAGLVRNNAGQILLLKSPDRGWEFPGGTVEYGEGIIKALEREILEETGVSVHDIYFAGMKNPFRIQDQFVL